MLSKIGDGGVGGGGNDPVGGITDMFWVIRNLFMGIRLMFAA